MSGYCPDCGNTMCVCDDLKDQEITIEEGFRLTIDLLKTKNLEIKKLKDMLIESKPWIETYETFDEDDEEERLALLQQYNELIGGDIVEGAGGIGQGYDSNF